MRCAVHSEPPAHPCRCPARRFCPDRRSAAASWRRTPEPSRRCHPAGGRTCGSSCSRPAPGSRRRGSVAWTPHRRGRRYRCRRGCCSDTASRSSPSPARTSTHARDPSLVRLSTPPRVRRKPNGRIQQQRSTKKLFLHSKLDKLYDIIFSCFLLFYPRKTLKCAPVVVSPHMFKPRPQYIVQKAVRRPCPRGIPRMTIGHTTTVCRHCPKPFSYDRLSYSNCLQTWYIL